jgi:hypothetical protein
LFIGVLTQSFNSPKTSHSDCSGHFEDDTMQNHEKKKVKIL